FVLRAMILLTQKKPRRFTGGLTTGTNAARRSASCCCFRSRISLAARRSVLDPDGREIDAVIVRHHDRDIVLELDVVDFSSGYCCGVKTLGDVGGARALNGRHDFRGREANRRRKRSSVEGGCNGGPYLVEL